MASTLVSTKVETENRGLNGSESLNPKGIFLVEPPVQANEVAAISTTWLKLNSTAPIQIQLEDVVAVPENEAFSGAKKLRYILENTNELIVCPGVYDGLSARTAIELDFKALYMVCH